MIAFIKGNLEAKSKGYIVIEVAGIGYKIYMPESAIAKLGEVGSNVKVYTFMRVREDDISLYGFITNEELRMFELLLSVSGIGAKGALTILSNVSPSQFALAVISNDVNVLKKWLNNNINEKSYFKIDITFSIFSINDNQSVGKQR